MNRLLRIEWDAIAGVVAAITAIVLHFLHVIDLEVLAVITLVLIAAMFIRLLRSYIIFRSYSPPPHAELDSASHLLVN